MISNPLCELHVHLEGCVWPTHIRRWWDKSKFLFPPPKFDGRKDFTTFLSYFRFNYNFLNSPEAYAWVARDYIISALENNICYAELQINLALLNTWSIDIVDVLEEIQNKSNTISNRPVIRFIADLPWQFPPSLLEDIISNFNSLRKLGLLGISLGGDETLAEPKIFFDLFNEARRCGLKVLCHAGETTPSNFAIDIVKELRPERIAHAITIAEWVELLGNKAPAIDVCLSSNKALGVIRSFSQHPLSRWINAGVIFSLSSDDPAVFNTNLTKEFAIARKTGLKLEEQYFLLKRNWESMALDINACKQAMNRT